MASSIYDYNSNYQALRTKIEVDLNNTGIYTDYTDYLEDYSLLTSLSNTTSGFVSTQANITLRIPDPDKNWARQGRRVRITVSISSDNWATQYDSVIFNGSTSKASSISDEIVSLVAKDTQNDLLKQKIGNFTSTSIIWETLRISQIVNNILSLVGYPSPSVTGIVADYFILHYFLDRAKTAEELINDLCVLAGLIVYQDTDGKFKGTSLLNFYSQNPEPKVEFTKDNTRKYISQQLSNSLLFNRIKVSGKTSIRITFSGIVVSPPIYNNSQISGQELRPGEEKTFFIHPEQRDCKIQDILQIELNSTLYSFVKFYNSDDGTGTLATISNISILSYAVLTGDNSDTIIFRARNNTSSSFWLKEAKIWGNAVYSDKEVASELKSELLIEEQKEEIVYEIESRNIQFDYLPGYISERYFNNFVSTTPQIYTIEVAARPDLRIGEVITFVDKDDVTHYAQIISIDLDAKMVQGSSTEGLFMATVMVKKILS